jgi:Ser/Thr protein kinase RdoA (MazF antagonist)
MKPYHQLTDIGKLRRLYNYAALGLTHYDLKAPTLKFYAFATNLLYKVSSTTGEKYILRLAYPNWRTLEDLTSEALWLSALHQDTDIPVPQVFPTRSGELVLSISLDGIPDVWHMTLMRWLPGRLLGNYLTSSNLEKMGSLFSKLHLHGKNWNPSGNFTDKRFDDWLSRGEENLISPYEDESSEGAKTEDRLSLSIERRQWLKRMDEHVKSAYQAIDPSDLRVIHCDLWHDNIKLQHGTLYPFDFEDTIWGYRAHDIAMAMLDLLETVGEENYSQLLAAFQKGYETNLPWPEDPIEPFQVGRLLWKLNWIARFQPDFLKKSLEDYIPVFETYEKNRRVTLPGKN